MRRRLREAEVSDARWPVHIRMRVKRPQDRAPSDFGVRLRLRIIGIATQFVPVPEDVLGVKPGDSTVVPLGNSGYGVVASADAIIDLIAAF